MIHTYICDIYGIYTHGKIYMTYIFFHDNKLKNGFLLLNQLPVNIRKVVMAADALQLRSTIELQLFGVEMYMCC